MKTSLFSGSTLVGLLACSTVVSGLWPAPRGQFKTGNSVVWANRNVKFCFTFPSANGTSGSTASYLTDQMPFSSPSSATASRARVWKALGRAYKQLFTDNYVPWTVNPRNANLTPGNGATLTSVTVRQSQDDPVIGANDNGYELDESYELTLSVSGTKATCVIDVKTSLGALRGLATLTQLFYAPANAGSYGSGQVYTKLAPISIKDTPKFPHRGLNLDCSRAYYPVADIERTIDAMSWNKMNRLHIHITDAQAWPLVIPSMPDLSAKGAYRPDLVYTPADLQNILQYADDRGIRVNLEIDMPGHTRSIAFSQPDIIVAAQAKPWDTYSAEPPAGQLALKNPKTTQFVSKLFDDLLPRLHANTLSTHFHTGGDEINKNVYSLEPGLHSNDSNVIQPLLQKFIDNTHSEVRKHKLRPMVWEEIPLDWNVTMKNDVVVQVWRSAENVLSAINKGYQVITGSYDFWYLDCGRGQWLDFVPTSFKNFYPFADYCSPYKNWRLIYSYDPLAGIPQKQQSSVLGGELHLWSETADTNTLDSLLWPRVSAGAEVLWSGRQDENGVNRTQPDASPRLMDFRARMVNRGVRASVVQMIYCGQNKGDCQL